MSTTHLAIFYLHSFSCDDTDFPLLCGDDEEESVVQVLLTDTVVVKNLHPDIKELMSLSVREKYNHNFFGSSTLVCCELL
ncbi:MAG: hypothetical protein WAW59_00190 [Patescibacteria group bacterium]